MAVAARGVEPPSEDSAWDHERPWDDTVPSDLRVGADVDKRCARADRFTRRSGVGCSSPRRASARRSSIVIRAIGAQAYGSVRARTDRRAYTPTPRRERKLVVSLQAPPRLTTAAGAAATARNGAM